MSLIVKVIDVFGIIQIDFVRLTWFFIDVWPNFRESVTSNIIEHEFKISFDLLKVKDSLIHQRIFIPKNISPYQLWFKHI